jgi:hypothetical protein
MCQALRLPCYFFLFLQYVAANPKPSASCVDDPLESHENTQLGGLRDMKVESFMPCHAFFFGLFILFNLNVFFSLPRTL